VGIVLCAREINCRATATPNSLENVRVQLEIELPSTHLD
jgi:hypothetical protein